MNDHPDDRTTSKYSGNGADDFDSAMKMLVFVAIFAAAVVYVIVALPT